MHFLHLICAVLKSFGPWIQLKWAKYAIFFLNLPIEVKLLGSYIADVTGLLLIKTKGPGNIYNRLQLHNFPILTLSNSVLFWPNIVFVSFPYVK